MTVVNCRVMHNDQNGNISATGAGYESGGTNSNVNMNPNSIVAFRFSTQIPAGATLNSATLKLYYNTKFGDSNGTSAHSLRYHSGTTNSAPLVPGVAEFNVRTVTSFTTFNANILAGSGNNVASIDVKSVMDTLMAGGLLPGGYVTFFVFCNTESGDMNWKYDADGAAPELILDYTEAAAPTEYWDFNQLKKPSFITDVDTWGVNDFFGDHTTVGATVTRDASFTRNGNATLKFTTPAADGTKGCGPMTGSLLNTLNASFIFCGWVYIPSTLLADVYADFHFYGGSKIIDGPRDSWQPFCTDVVSIGSSVTGVFPTVDIRSGFVAGQNIWLSDLALYKSNFRQMSFTSNTPDKATTIQHIPRYTTGRGVVARRSVPKGRVTGSTLPRRTYSQTSSGIWVETAGKQITPP